MGPSPITYPDIQAYFALHGIKPQGWELACIRKLDGIALTSSAKKDTDAKRERKPRKPR